MLSILFFLLIIIAITAFLGTFYYKRIRQLGSPFNIILSVIITIGVALNFLFFWGNNYSNSTYDTEGHLNYVEYVFNQKTIPSPDKFWGAYNPPLYYLILASTKRVLSFLNLDEENARTGYQALSFLFISLGNLLFCDILLRIFPQRKKGGESFLAVISSFITIFFLPGIVMQSFRINNDVLFYFIFALISWFFFRQKNYSRLFWVLIAGLNFLLAFTKKHAILILPMEIWFWLKQKNPPTKKIWHPIILFAVIPLAMFIHVYSYNIPFGNSGITSALVEGSFLQQPSKKLEIDTDPRFLVDVSLVRLMENPYLDILNPLKKHLNNYFLEYLIRTSIFSENAYPKLLISARILMFSYILLLLILLVGIYKCLKKAGKNFYSQETFFLLFFLEGILASLLFRTMLPYFCSQDFRYISFIILPMAYFCGKSFEGANLISKKVFWGIVLFFFLASVNFLLSLIYQYKF